MTHKHCLLLALSGTCYTREARAVPNGTQPGNGARSNSFPEELFTRGRKLCAPSFPARQPPAKLGPFQTRREVWLEMAEATSSILIHNLTTKKSWLGRR